jgi:hypothetical protein
MYTQHIYTVKGTDILTFTVKKNGPLIVVKTYSFFCKKDGPLN